MILDKDFCSKDLKLRGKSFPYGEGMSRGFARVAPRDFPCTAARYSPPAALLHNLAKYPFPFSLPLGTMVMANFRAKAAAVA